MAASGTGRLTADARRASILEAARPVFASRGFHGTNTAELAAAAGCSEPMLYKHFPSKQALFAAVLRDAGSRLREGLLEAAARHPDDPLAGWLGFVEKAVDEPFFLEAIRLRSLAVALVDVPEVREAIQTSVESQRASLAGLVREGQAAGTVRADADADAVGWTVVGLSLLGGLRHALEGQPGAVGTLAAIRALVEGLRPVRQGGVA